MSNNNTITFTQDEKIYNGIDVSSYQGDIDFNRVRVSGIDVVYIKAGEGGTLTDSNFQRNYERAKRAGLIIGFYYYATALTTNEARLQAREFHNLIKDKSVQARPAMDYENFDGLEREDINAIGLAFLEELERLSGVTPMIYSDAYSAQSIWDDRFAKFPLWLADYSRRDEFPSDIIVWESWTGYQYSDTGEVPGIQGNVDMNLFKDGILTSLNENTMPSGGRTTVEYIVRPGDSLWEIARRFRTTVPALVSLNGIADPSLIYIGQILRIPD